MIAARKGTEPGLQAHSGIRPTPPSDFVSGFFSTRRPLLSGARALSGAAAFAGAGGSVTIDASPTSASCAFTEKSASREKTGVSL